MMSSPCEPCCKRGEEHLCTWDAAPKTQQPFALRSELEDIRGLLAELYPEAADRVEELRRRAATASATLSRAEKEKPVAPKSNGNAARMLPPSVPRSLDASFEGVDPDSDTEDAATALEEMAMRGSLNVTRPPEGTRIGNDASQPLLPGKPMWNVAPPEPKAERWRLVTGETHILERSPPASQMMLSIYESILQLLPSDEMIDLLLSRARPALSWHSSLIHWDTFGSELRQFKGVRATPAATMTDPAWTAILLQLIILGHSNGAPDASLAALQPEPWIDSVMLCLQAANWTSVPRYRSIVALLLYIPIHFLQPFRPNHHMPPLMAVAVRLALSLNWHKLGSDRTLMPGGEDDLGLPYGACSLRRQVVLVAWSNVLFGSFVMAQSGRNDLSLFSLNLAECDTEYAWNLDQNEVGAQLEVQPRPLHETTDCSMERIKRILVEHSSAVHQLFARSDFQYDQLIPIEETLRAHINATRGPVAKLSVNQAIELSGLNHQLLRMHRPWLSRGYKKPLYLRSTNTCVEAARVIIECARIAFAESIRYFFMPRHNIGAVVVLAVHVFNLLDHDGDAQEIAGIERDIADSLKYFEMVSVELAATNESNNINTVSEQGIQICRNLQQAIRERVASRASGRPASRESVTAVFKRISGSMADSPTNVAASPTESLLFNSPLAAGAGNAPAAPFGSYLGSTAGVHSNYSWATTQSAAAAAAAPSPAPWTQQQQQPGDATFLIPAPPPPAFDLMGLPTADWAIGLLGSDVFDMDRGDADPSLDWLQATNMGGL